MIVKPSLLHESETLTIEPSLPIEGGKSETLTGSILKKAKCLNSEGFTLDSEGFTSYE